MAIVTVTATADKQTPKKMRYTIDWPEGEIPEAEGAFYVRHAVAARYGNPKKAKVTIEFEQGQ